MSSSLSKKIITYDAVERYHDNLEEQLNNEYLRKDELVQSNWDCNDAVSNEYIKNRTHFAQHYTNIAELNLQDGWTSDDVLCSVEASYFDCSVDTEMYFIQITNNSGNFEANSISVIPKDGLNTFLIVNGPSVSATWHKVINDPEDPSLDTYELILNNNYSIDNSLSIDLMYVYKQLNEAYIPVSIARVDNLPVEKGTGDNSIVQKGSNNVASGKFSVALGKDSNASGNYSFASGNSVASGEYSHAEGVAAVENGVTRLTKAIGKASHAEGEGCHASATGAHAEGMWTDASKNGSHAEGYKTVADAQYSHAEGNESKTTGNISHAEGKGTQAKGRASHTEGWYTIANNESEHASGKFNLSTKSSDKSQATQFSIGIGTSDTNRKNAFEVKQNGDIYVDGVEGRIQDRLNIDLLVPIEHSDLKKLRDNNQLIPGQKYRITDYITTTTQENTSSMFNLFDVVVTALDEHTLSENASAVKSVRDGDGYFSTENVEAWQLKYCLDNDTERFAWADNSAIQWYSRIVANYIVDQSGTQTYSLDKESYIYDYGTVVHPDTGENTLVFYTADPMYFAETGADHLDKYFYNGITTVDGVEYDSWRKFSDNGWVNANADGDGLFALTERVVYNGRFVWPDRTGIENGKGVIYNMIDEYGNECPYDFKNIKFYHDGLGTYVYTFTWIDEEYNVMDTSVFGNNGTLTLYGEIDGVHSNVIKPYIKMIYDEDTDDYLGTKQSLNNITFISDYAYELMGNEGFYGCYNNSFGNNCYGNSFGNYCYSNSFGDGCSYNSFGNNCDYNSFRLSASLDATLLCGCCYNCFDDNCSYNVIWNGNQKVYTAQMTNIHVVRGVSGTQSSYNFINVESDANYEIKVAKNSSGVIKIYCEADLIA